MRNMKRMIALLLVAMLAIGLAATGFAAEPVTGSITIRNAASGVEVAGKTFNAYKLLDATMVDVNDPAKGIAYTVPAELKQFYQDRYHVEPDAPDFDQQVAAAIAEEADMYAFAKDALAAAKAAGVQPNAATAGPDAEEVTISNLSLGYYVIEDVGAKAPISALLLDTVGNVAIQIKADQPTVDKKIDGNKDKDDATAGPVEANNAAIGDKVPYVVTSKVPDMTGYEKYFFVVNDTLSKGLTFNEDVAITIDGQPLPTEQYAVTFHKAESGETTVEIVFKNFIQHKEKAGAAIVITYSATVNADAVIGTAGNPNKVQLVYSNNPNKAAHGEPENPDKPGPEDADVTGETPEEMTKTYVTELELTKVNEDGTRLTGAEFQLTGTRLNTVLVTKDVFTESPEGTFYQLTDGTYTETKPEEHTLDQYVNPDVTYAKKTETQTIVKSDEVQVKGTVGSDGVLRFTGLSAGQYEITELKAPDGYNLLTAPIQVTVTCKTPAAITTGAEPCTWEVTLPGKISADGNRIELNVVNKTGTELPSTGGMGTTLFYVVGGLLVAGAAVALIVKKRMASK